MKHFLFYLSFYNFIYPIRLSFIPNFEYLLYVILFIWMNNNWNYVAPFFNIKEYKKTILFCSVMIIIGALSSIINQGDYLSLIIFFKFLFGVSVAVILGSWANKLYGLNSFVKILRLIIFSGLIIAISNVIEFFYLPFRFFLLGIIDTTGNTAYDTSFRTHGFASSGGASLSVGILITSILSLFRYTVSVNKIERVKYLIIGVFLYISLMVIGRTGLFIGAPIIFYILVFYNSNFKKIFYKGIIIMPIFALMISLVDVIDEKDINIFYKYSLEPIYNYIEYGKFESRSSNAVSNMYYLPEDAHLFLGAGYWRWPTYSYELSDVGYMKILMSTGLIGMFIFFRYQIIIYYNSYLFYKKRYKFKVGFFLLFFVPFLLEAKEEFLTQNYGFKIMILLITYSWFFTKSLKRKNLCAE